MATVPATREQARSAKAAALKHFQQFGDVVGVGITRLDDGYAVKVNLTEPPAPGVEVPAVIDGVPVLVEIVGIIKPR
jgi:hypothetical protein